MCNVLCVILIIDSTWGMEGYVLICKDCDENGDQGECGILDDPSYPEV